MNRKLAAVLLVAAVVMAILPVVVWAQGVPVPAFSFKDAAMDEVSRAFTAALKLALAAFFTALSGAVATVGYKLWEVARKWLATTRYGQYLGILGTALQQAIARKAKNLSIHPWELVRKLARIFRDGKVSEEERVELTAIRKDVLSDAAQIAGAMISECRGLAAEQAGKRVGEELDMLLGELEYRLTGSPEALIPSGLENSEAAGS